MFGLATWTWTNECSRKRARPPTRRGSEARGRRAPASSGRAAARSRASSRGRSRRVAARPAANSRRRRPRRRPVPLLARQLEARHRSGEGRAAVAAARARLALIGAVRHAVEAVEALCCWQIGLPMSLMPLPSDGRRVFGAEGLGQRHLAVGSPDASDGPSTARMPTRVNWRPVRIAARLHAQTGHAVEGVQDAAARPPPRRWRACGRRRPDRRSRGRRRGRRRLADRAW